MVGYITESTGGNYAPTPEGQHLMVCSRIIDLGTQPGSAMYPSPKRKIRIFWEIPDERVKFTDQDGNEREGPVLHSEQYTVSFNEKANLRKDLERWRGAAFKAEDFQGPPNGFHLSKLIGIPAMAQIVHEHKDGKTYANLNSIMKPPKAMFDQYRDKIEGDKIFFDLDDFQQEAFDKLSDRLKATIMASPEYQAMFGKPSNGQHQNSYQESENPGYGMGGAAGGRSDYDSEIPFAACWWA